MLQILQLNIAFNKSRVFISKIFKSSYQMLKTFSLSQVFSVKSMNFSSLEQS